MDVYQDAILAMAYGRNVKYESLEEKLNMRTVKRFFNDMYCASAIVV